MVVLRERVQPVHDKLAIFQLAVKESNYLFPILVIFILTSHLSTEALNAVIFKEK